MKIMEQKFNRVRYGLQKWHYFHSLHVKKFKIMYGFFINNSLILDMMLSKAGEGGSLSEDTFVILG